MTRGDRRVGLHRMNTGLATGRNILLQGLAIREIFL